MRRAKARLSWWEELVGPKEKFSLKRMQYLLNRLKKNRLVNDRNANTVMASLRELVDLLLWGDQHQDPTFFEFFLENNMLSYFANTLSRTTNKQVKIELIKTLNLLVLNLSDSLSVFYLYSNNRINELITHHFDFNDDELLAYFIAFLKAVSLRLDAQSLQFFFNQKKPMRADPGGVARRPSFVGVASYDFPLYTEAIKFFHHRDKMIRIAVRTLTLNVYRIPDARMRRFILDPSVPYFTNLAHFIHENGVEINRLLAHSTHTEHRALGDALAELSDWLFYLGDIFELNIAPLNAHLAESLHTLFVGPLLRQWHPRDDDGGEEDLLAPHVVLVLLAHILAVFSFRALVSPLAEVLLSPAGRRPAQAHSAPSRRHSLPPPRPPPPRPDALFAPTTPARPEMGPAGEASPLPIFPFPLSQPSGPAPAAAPTPTPTPAPAPAPVPAPAPALPARPALPPRQPLPRPPSPARSPPPAQAPPSPTYGVPDDFDAMPQDAPPQLPPERPPRPAHVEEPSAAPAPQNPMQRELQAAFGSAARNPDVQRSVSQAAGAAARQPEVQKHAFGALRSGAFSALKSAAQGGGVRGAASAAVHNPAVQQHASRAARAAASNPQVQQHAAQAARHAVTGAIEDRTRRFGQPAAADNSSPAPKPAMRRWTPGGHSNEASSSPAASRPAVTSTPPRATPPRPEPAPAPAPTAEGPPAGADPSKMSLKDRIRFFQGK
eukprot:gnl/Trimastix_PCT/2740.p1 GENE.gnl/Trimastix_PCT/2740~~gnl/Trimastix_PCT/2740.p1  ORF type:complete len:720 (-),score=216.96 gnl/Trimastix_PCT/2740:130-2289(-)